MSTLDTPGKAFAGGVRQHLPEMPWKKSDLCYHGAPDFYPDCCGPRIISI